MAYLPLFIDITNQRLLIVGGGNIAYHKAKVLLEFEGNITLIAPTIIEPIKALPITIIEEEIQKETLLNYDIVIVATDNTLLNHELSQYCKEHKILVNVVDQKEDCSFIFPSYLKEKDIIAAYSSSGKSPLITQYLKEKEKEIITPILGEINDYLGSLRPMYRSLPIELRKQLYKEILSTCLSLNRVLSESELKAVEELCITKSVLEDQNSH